MSDIRERESDEDLMRCWQESIPGGQDGEKLARTLASKVNRFDRMIFWRNFREYVAGFALLIWAGYQALQGRRQGYGMMAVVLFVMGYLWRKQRGLKALDPSADAQEYRTALLGRYDQQIRRLSQVKYWYLLPLYLQVVWQTVEMWPGRPWMAALPLIVVTVLYAFLGWLNEVYAVRNLQAARANVEAMFEEKE